VLCWTARVTEGFDTPDLKKAKVLLDEFVVACEKPEGVAANGNSS
jgi:hypothetical protein